MATFLRKESISESFFNSRGRLVLSFDRFNGYTAAVSVMIDQQDKEQEEEQEEDCESKKQCSSISVNKEEMDKVISIFEKVRDEVWEESSASGGEEWSVEVVKISEKHYKTVFRVGVQSFTIGESKENENAEYHTMHIKDFFLQALDKIGIKKKRVVPRELHKTLLSTVRTLLFQEAVDGVVGIGTLNDLNKVFLDYGLRLEEIPMLLRDDEGPESGRD